MNVLTVSEMVLMRSHNELLKKGKLSLNYPYYTFILIWNTINGYNSMFFSASFPKGDNICNPGKERDLPLKEKLCPFLLGFMRNGRKHKTDRVASL